MISIISDSVRAVSAGPKRSRTIARATTAPAQPPMAWTKRAAISAPMSLARAQTTEAATKIRMPAMIGGRRPNRSDAGP